MYESNMVVLIVQPSLAESSCYTTDRKLLKKLNYSSMPVLLDTIQHFPPLGRDLLVVTTKRNTFFSASRHYDTPGTR
jgi:hypothetical protein